MNFKHDKDSISYVSIILHLNKLKYLKKLIILQTMKNLILLGCVFFSVISHAAKIDTLSIESAYLKKTSKCIVISPTFNKNGKDKFPVVYLLHGYSGTFSSWVELAPQLTQKSDELNIIIVTPDGGFGSWYFDSPIDSSIRYESFVTKELVPYIDQNYPTIVDKNKRAITGLSMGGHGGLYLSIKNQQLFGAAGSMSGGVDFRPFPNNWEIKKALGNYNDNTSLWDSNVVVNLIEALPNKALAILIDCGIDDFFITVNRNLHKKLIELKIDHDYIERPGAHNKAYWKNSVDYQLLFFKKFFDEKK